MNLESVTTQQDPPGNIMVIEDHEPLWDVIRRACDAERWSFQFFASAEGAMAKVASSPGDTDLAVVDLCLPGMGGVEVLHTLHQMDYTLPVILLTSLSDSPTVVQCMKLGAYDFITKPFRNTDLVHRFRLALEERRLVRRCVHFESSEYLRALMGPSKAVQRLAEAIHQVSPTEMAVLIEGESGTGKEILARYIHFLSHRNRGPFVAVDYGAIPDTLLEGELFGSRKGSFTGAVANHDGKFRMADGGTLFLDEIANLPLHMQVKLLRVLQERVVMPVGGTDPVPFSARLVTATNSSLEAEIRKGKCRLDVYHRVAEFPVCTTPLRERIEDLMYLCTRFVQDACAEFGKQIEGFSEEALDQIVSYPWPGNVRELKSVIRRAVLVNTGRIERVFPQHELQPGTRVFIAALGGNTVVRAEVVIGKDMILRKRVPLKQIQKQVTREINQAIVNTVLQYVGGNKSDAARILEVDYKTVHTLCKGTANGKEVSPLKTASWQ